VGEVPEQIYADGRKAYEDLDFQKAEEKFAEFVWKYPDHDYAPPAYLWLAKARVRINDSTGAIEAFRKAAEVAPEPGVRIESLVNLAQLYRERGEWNQALATLRELVDTTQGDNQKNFAIGYGSTLWESGDVEGASEYLHGMAEVAKSPRHRADFLLSLAELESLDNKFTEEAAVLSEIINDASTPAERATTAYLWRGNALAQAGETEAAEANYRELRERYPDSIDAVEAMVELAALAKEENEPERAAAWLHDASMEFAKRIRSATDDVAARIQLEGRLARAYFRLGRYEAALHTYEKIQRMNPGDARLEEQVEALKREVREAMDPRRARETEPTGEGG